MTAYIAAGCQLKFDESDASFSYNGYDCSSWQDELDKVSELYEINFKENFKAFTEFLEKKLIPRLFNAKRALSEYFARNRVSFSRSAENIALCLEECRSLSKTLSAATRDGEGNSAFAGDFVRGYATRRERKRIRAALKESRDILFKRLKENVFCPSEFAYSYYMGDGLVYRTECKSGHVKNASNNKKRIRNSSDFGLETQKDDYSVISTDINSKTKKAESCGLRTFIETLKQSLLANLPFDNFAELNELVEKYRNIAEKEVIKLATHLGAMSIIGVLDAEKAVKAKYAAFALSVANAKTVKVKNVSDDTTSVKWVDPALSFASPLEVVAAAETTAEATLITAGGTSEKRGFTRTLANMFRVQKAEKTQKTIRKPVFKNVMRTAFNYTAPAMSLVLLFNLIAGQAQKEYGIEVEFDGQSVGVITSDKEYADAEQAVRQLAGLTAELPNDPKYVLKVINDKNEIIDSNTLAETILSNTDSQFAQAYNIYVDDVLIGTVADKEPIAAALDEKLQRYIGEGSIAENVSFSKEIRYEETTREVSALSVTAAVIEKLMSAEEIVAVYITKSGDTITSIAKEFSQNTIDLSKLNPDVDFANLKGGERVLYSQKVSFLPVSYTKKIRSVVYTDYDVVKTETAKLYKGREEVVTEGQRGETSNVYSVSYLDGTEVAKVLLSSQVTKLPVTEEVNVGTLISAPQKYSTYQEQLPANGTFIWPVNGGYISAGLGDGRGHRGVDIPAPRGTDIYAGRSGTVTFSGVYYGYGNCVIIDHGDGYTSLYAHMVETKATVGQYVEQGEIVGYVGDTGNAYGCHLHIEISYNGQIQNPLNYISKPN